MKISVIIPTYNEEKDVGECLTSLLGQSEKDIEIIVVDDGSNDETLNVLEKIKNGNEKINILKQKHLGAGAARNLGAKRARGEILVFVDADMTFDKDFLEKLVAPIVKGRVKGTFSKEEIVSNWESLWARSLNIEEGWEEKRRHGKNYPNEQWVFRAVLKSEFERVGGYDPGGYADDWSLGKKLGYKAVKAGGAKFYHKNPDTLKEVFQQARWIGKREYKFGKLGFLFALIRSSFPFSIIIGVIKAVINIEPFFLIFKVVYDLGVFIGISDYLLTGKGAK